MMLQRINLVPQKPLSETLKVITPVILFLLVGLILVSVFVNFKILESRIASTERESASIQDKQLQANILLANKQRLAGEISTLAEQKEVLVSEITKIESIRSKKRLYTKALNIISGALPASVKCNKITFKEGTGALEGIAVKYQDLPVLINELKDSGFIRFAVLNEVDRATGGGTPLTFRITFGIE